MYGSSSSSSFHSTRSSQHPAPERRSTAGPMEWEPENPRKRAHYDPTLPPSSPFTSNHYSQPNSNNPLFPFKSAPSPLVDSPFLFHTNGSGASALGSAPRGAMIPGANEQGEEEGRRSTFDPTSFDFGNTSRVFGIPEVEMASYNPTPTKNVDQQPKEEPSWYGIGTGEVKQEEQEEEEEEEPRKVASGAVRREMRKREGGGLRRKGSVGSGLRNGGGGLRRRERERERSGSDGEGEGGSESDDDNDRRTSSHKTKPSSRSRNNTSALQRTNSHNNANEGAASTQNFNLHLPGRTVSHGEIPYILLGYLQFFFNLSLVLILLYLAVQFILTVKSDIARKVEEVSFEILQEIASCTNLYLANQCDPARRVPGMQASCTAWEYCMNRDPTIVGRAKVGAETFAGVVNSFVDPISWKTMSFTLVTLTFLTIVLNSALSFYRSSHRPPSHDQQPSHHRHQLQPPPSWQQHQYSGLPPMGGNDPYGAGGGYGYSGMPPRGEWEGGVARRLGGGEGEKGEGKEKKKGWF